MSSGTKMLVIRLPMEIHWLRLRLTRRPWSWKTLKMVFCLKSLLKREKRLPLAAHWRLWGKREKKLMHLNHKKNFLQLYQKMSPQAFLILSVKVLVMSQKQPPLRPVKLSQMMTFQSPPRNRFKKFLLQQTIVSEFPHSQKKLQQRKT